MDRAGSCFSSVHAPMLSRERYFPGLFLSKSGSVSYILGLNLVFNKSLL